MTDTVAWFLMLLLLGRAWGNPIVYHDPDSRPLAVVSELSQRLASHSPVVADTLLPEPRLPPLPSPQELEAIKKVAQILIMLGEQVIPTIIGESGSTTAASHNGHSASVSAGCDQPSPAEEIPNDPVNDQ